MTTLSERIRPGSDAAPWVIQAIKELEQQLAAKDAEMQVSIGVGDGTGSLFVHGSYDAVKTVQAKLLELESVRRQLAAKEEELERAGSAPAVQGEPVGRVKTVGGYPDESEHTVEWLCKYKDLKNGDLLYATPQPAAHPAITHCDNCGCDWLDNGLNPIGCPYCKKPAPDVYVLVEALEQCITSMLDSGYRADSVVIRAARAALASPAAEQAEHGHD